MYSIKSHRPTWAEININAIRQNFKLIQSKTPNDSVIMGIVKADAYGHGAVAISQELTKLGCDYLGISNIDEALELRDNSISCPILILGPVEPSEFGKIIEFNLFPTVTGLDYARALSETYRYKGIFAKIHVKVDTGMGRLGIPYEKALLEIEQISKLDGLLIDGIYSHFSSADDDPDFTQAQVKKFNSLIQEIKKLAIKSRYFHIANSAAVFKSEPSLQSPYNMIRPGLSVYGYSTFGDVGLKNSMSLKSRIIDIRKMKRGQTVSYSRTYAVKDDFEYIAVVPIGYADGIPTVYSNHGKVMIKGKLYPSVGRVCMDYTMASLGSNPDKIEIGDEVEFFGPNSMSVEKFGKLINRIPYEVTCGISKRVPRIYIRKEDER